MISRKKIIKNSMAVAATLAAGQLLAKADSSSQKKYGNAVIESSQECIEDAKICLTHCITEMGDGNKTLVACAKSVQSVIAGCEAIVSLAAAKSPYLSEMAKLCIKMCSDCQKECEKHAKHHEECANCAESCKKCIQSLKTV